MLHFIHVSVTQNIGHEQLLFKFCLLMHIIHTLLAIN